MQQIECKIDYDNLDKITVEEALEQMEFVDEMNYLLAEGMVRCLENADGEPCFYPGDWTDEQIMEHLKNGKAS